MKRSRRRKASERRPARTLVRLLRPDFDYADWQDRVAGATGRFRTEVFERYQRSEKALVMAMMEMYLQPQGVSTRKVKAVTEELCNHEFSSATISRIVSSLDEQLEKFARRPLEEEYPYLILDGPL